MVLVGEAVGSRAFSLEADLTGADDSFVGAIIGFGLEIFLGGALEMPCCELLLPLEWATGLFGIDFADARESLSGPVDRIKSAKSWRESS